MKKKGLPAAAGTTMSYGDPDEALAKDNEVDVTERQVRTSPVANKSLQSLAKRAGSGTITDAEGLRRAYEQGDAYSHGKTLYVAGSHTARDWMDDVTRIPFWRPLFGGSKAIHRYQMAQQAAAETLCMECHREKTANEARMYDDDQLASHFEREVWEQYVMSPRPPPLIAKLRNGSPDDLEVADVIRCRRSALLYNVHPLPIFCPLDDIQVRTKPELGDLVFSTKASPRHLASGLGYTGPGWIHRVQAEWLLHTSVLTWDDLSHTLTATAHLPAGLLSEPLRIMEEAWDGDLTLAKLSVNSLIGLWAIDEQTSIKVRSSRREDDAPAQGCLTSIFHYGDEQCIYDFVTRTKLLSNASCRPLHDLCMCTEAVRVGQMLLTVKMAKAIPYELRTDSVTFRPQKRRKVELDKVTYRDLDTIYTNAFPIARPPVQLTAIGSNDHPFRNSK